MILINNWYFFKIGIEKFEQETVLTSVKQSKEKPWINSPTLIKKQSFLKMKLNKKMIY